MNIPTTKTLSDAERFCIGLRMLAAECNMSKIEYCGLGVKIFRFSDGSSVGGMRAYVEAGLIKNVKNE